MKSFRWAGHRERASQSAVGALYGILYAEVMWDTSRGCGGSAEAQAPGISNVAPPSPTRRHQTFLQSNVEAGVRRSCDSCGRLIS